MKLDIKGLLSGLYNSIFVDEFVENVAKERNVICDGCEFNSSNAKKKGYKSSRPDVHCTDCGCDLHLKTRCLFCECPKQYWVAHMTKEEWEAYKNNANAGNS